MRRKPTLEAIKQERINHLEYCLEILLRKDDGYNELEVRRLYGLIYRVICEMKEMSAVDAANYFKNSITDEVRKSLLKFNIDLVVY